ncbi:hypothetical protein ASE14_15240 [Agromyces sp. Root81]|uniref:nuclear transport factor 2 family protein n=1 Tax=Agromyces sp. Root81 TaxID=1736601 RepID=UPI0006F5BB47|nr:nuclear transport factor 2 family protein [Agromyces sp. Root81]KRC59132.1 hypothetical protein ASE14_15240 [Agromyces sp. Root81]
MSTGSDTAAQSLEARALAAELALLQSSVRSDAAAVEALLHPRFREFGRSGREWTRDEMIAALANDPADGGQVAEASDYVAEIVGDGLVLLTYRSRDERGDALRSSLWDLTEETPRVRFHQATPTTARG